MIAFRHIVVPTDFSTTSDVAVQYARALAEAFDATLHLVHVLESPYLTVGPTELYVPPPQTFVAELEREAHARLENLLPAADRNRFRAQIVLRMGRPFAEIVDYAREVKGDLIVMGTHGRGAIAHMLMGSVTEKVVRIAPCPVLTVRHPDHDVLLSKESAA